MPILILSGWRAWPVMSRRLARTLAATIERIRGTAGQASRGTPGVGRFGFLPVSFHDLGTIDACVERVVTRAVERFGADAECQIVGVSMGGLIARKAVLDGHGGARIRARRVFTLATPHRGSRLARTIALDASALAMKPGSRFLKDLDAREASAWNGTRPYELVCYARLGDMWVGATNAAPPGEHPIWVPPLRFQPSHLTISRDTRIIDDIAARISGKEPLLKPNGPPPRD